MTTDIKVLSPYGSFNDLKGIEEKRSYASTAAAIITDGDMPEDFPFHLWTEQSIRYMEYWAWFTGARLSSDTGTTKDGKTVSKFPLQINLIRTAVRKSAYLVGGEAPDNPAPVIKANVKPKRSLYEDEVPEDKKKTAKFYTNIINEIWEQSNGNSIIYENLTLSQFLGGCYFKYEYVPPQVRPELRIPIVVKKIIPDFVMPIWDTENEFRLNEVWIVYRISKVAAKREYGVDIENMWGNYVEHWTKDKYSIHIDNKPLVAKYTTPYGGEVKIDYGNQTNPFGFVPVVYSPRLREGNFYGSSIVPDIAALTLEYNGRFADVGTLVHRLAAKHWFGRNISGNPKPKKLTNGVWYVDLGMQNPSINNPPEVWAEEPSEVSTTLIQFNESINNEFKRQSSLTDVAFGEVDGTQRSGETLKSLMWPAVAVVRPQRANLSTAKSNGDAMALDMLAIKGVKIEGVQVELMATKDYKVQQDWFPILPKDREATVTEVATLSGAERMSIHQSLVQTGLDIDDIEEEEKRIKEEIEWKAELEKPPEPIDNGGSSGGDKKE